MTDLRVIVGGLAPLGEDDTGLIERVHCAESDAREIERLIAPGMAVAAKSTADLHRLIAMADSEEATAAYAAFKEAAAAAQRLQKMLRLAETRLLIAITAAARDRSAFPD
jgi:hypothetical protein